MPKHSRKPSESILSEQIQSVQPEPADDTAQNYCERFQEATRKLFSTSKSPVPLREQPAM